MALDVKSVAILTAGIQQSYRRARDESATVRPHFWTEETLDQASKMRGDLKLDHRNEDDIDSLEKYLWTQLDQNPNLCQTLEQQYPNLVFAELLVLLAKDLVDAQKVQSSQIPKVAEVLNLVKSRVDPAELHAGLVQTALFFDQRLAAQVAEAFQQGLPFPWAQALEMDAVLKSREIRKVLPRDSTEPGEAQLIGLALSGGGIRSATLNLGILQSLAELKLSRYLDYLSTVSGGGYIATWLHAWIRSAGAGNVAEALSPAISPDPESTATRPIKWLRQYSNYLAPHTGLLSVDSLSIIVIWLRNTLLNMAVIILTLAAALMIPRGAMVMFDVVHHRSVWDWIGLLPLAAAVLMIVWNLRSFGNRDVRKDHFWFQLKGIHLLVACPLFLSAMLVAGWLYEVRQGSIGFLRFDSWLTGFFFVLLCGISFFGDYRQNFFDDAIVQPGEPWSTILFALAVLTFNAICALFGGLLLEVVDKLFHLFTGPGGAWHELVWGTVAVSNVYALVIILHLGLFGRNLPDDRREWWSRLGAVLTLWILAWIALAGTAIYGPWLVAMSVNHSRGEFVGGLLGSGWLGTTLAGVLKARSDQTGPSTNSPISELLARIAPPVFVVGLLVLVSFGVQMATIALSGFGFAGMNRVETRHYDFLSWWTPLDAWIAFVVLLGLAVFLSSRVDINQFSMHNFYKNRLVRCYLGASHRHRRPNRFTGFDPEDDFQLASLSPFERSPYTGPYPIVNTTLNLSSGEELAWQERKAQAFSFTPLFSGFAATPTEERGRPKAKHDVSLHAYRRTSAYAYPHGGGIRIGTAMAISGAAVSPNMGYHTSPATAFLLTVFNVRLGSWIGNPRDQICWRRSGPGLGLGYLLVELSGAANNKSNYVYLSDGGHFENLGIYELVRRRCRYIIACDGGQDEAFSFEDLGNAVRKCRADFGVEIDIDLSSIRPKPPSPPSTREFNGTHCAVGTISYPDAPQGTLIYLKSSLTGDEPADVLEYATAHPEFPHQTTADQFFDESQFESYRKLGYHIGMTVLGDAAKRRLKVPPSAGPGGGAPTLDSDRARFFSELRQRWRASSPNTATSFSRHAEALVKLMRRLRNDPDLEFLDTQMTPEWERLMSGAVGTHVAAPDADTLGLPPTSAERRAGFHFCNALFQLMEDVYLDLNLETEFGHPDNVGWMNLFNHWSWSAMFRVAWMISASCYGSRFRSFCEDRLKLDATSIGSIQISKATSVKDPCLNYRERELLGKDVFNWENDTLHRLEIIVKRPDPPHKNLTTLTVGVAVISGGKLVYFRIQEHLRNMGLARRMIDAMILDPKCAIHRKPAWRAGLDTLSEPVIRENQERVERIIDSAWRRKENRQGDPP